MYLDALQVRCRLYQSYQQKLEKKCMNEQNSVALPGAMNAVGAVVFACFQTWSDPVVAGLQIHKLKPLCSSSKFIWAQQQCSGVQHQSQGLGNISWPGICAASGRRSESLGLAVETKETAEMPGERQRNRSPCPREQDLAANAPSALYQPDWKHVGCCWRRMDAITKSFKWIIFSSPLSFSTGKVILTS